MSIWRCWTRGYQGWNHRSNPKQPNNSQGVPAKRYALFLCWAKWQSVTHASLDTDNSHLKAKGENGWEKRWEWILARKRPASFIITIYININQIIKLISSHHSHLIPYTLRVKRHNVRHIHTHVYTYCVSLKLGEKVRTLYISTLFLTVLVKVRWEYTAAKWESKRLYHLIQVYTLQKLGQSLNILTVVDDILLSCRNRQLQYDVDHPRMERLTLRSFFDPATVWVSGSLL